MNLIICIRSLLVASLVFGASSASLYADNHGSQNGILVAAIEAGELADLVAISGGLQQGIERGMLLSVFREGRKIGELLVTRSDKDCSAALITQISPHESLAIGDRAKIKVQTL
ncbi:MAG: hypothetical protein O3C43_00425 [Verrucomicrobia bacterium]|nr:hypothetical protein [Verrucomicrobiota bacterium]MDA1064943.1 hypothetical protein [Verrucomicrobiota bacterium]